jgi:hypothetical protein
MLIYDIAPGQELPELCGYKWPHGFVVRKSKTGYVFAPRRINEMIAFFAEGKTIQEAEKKAAKMWGAPLASADAPNTLEGAVMGCIGYLQSEGLRHIDVDIIRQFIGDFYHDAVVSDTALRQAMDNGVKAGILRRWAGEDKWFYAVTELDTLNPLEAPKPNIKQAHNLKSKQKFIELLATVKELTEARVPTTKQAIQRAMFKTGRERWQKRYLVWAVRDGLLVKGEAGNGEVVYLIP